MKKNEVTSVKSIIEANLSNELAQAFMKLVDTPLLIIKALLGLFLTASIALSAFLTVQSFISFFAYDVTTTSRIIVETPAKFPKVTICNLNPFTSRFSQAFLRNVSETYAIKPDIFEPSQMERLNYSAKVELYQRLYKLALIEMNMPQFEKRQAYLSRDLSEILLSCKFNKKPCNQSEDFKREWDVYWGNCWSFNWANTKESQYSGEDYGLTVEMYVNFNENLTQINSYNRGMGVVLHVENNSYLSGDRTGSVFLMPGVRTHIAIERSFKSNLPRPFSNCDIDNVSPGDFDSELYNFLLTSQYQYSQQLCYTQCNLHNFVLY